MRDNSKFNFSKILEFINSEYLLIFIVFFFIYFLLGLVLTYTNNIVLNIKYDLIYNLDTGRVFSEFTKLDYNRYVGAHLLSPLLYSSTFFLFKFLSEPKISFLLMQSTLGSLSVLLMYLTLGMLNPHRWIKILLTLIFGFSFSNLIFSSIPECYILAGFLNITLICYFVYLYQNRDRLNLSNIIVLSFISVLYAGVNIINFINAGILILFLIVTKNYKAEQTRTAFANFITFIVTIICIFSSLTFLQKLSFPNETNPFYVIKTIVKSEQILEWDPIIYYNNSIDSTKQVIDSITGSYIKPLYALKTTIRNGNTIDLSKSDTEIIKHRIIEFADNQNPLRFTFAIILYSVLLFTFLKNKKRYIENKLIPLFFYIGLMNLLFNLFYQPEYSFLYSQNHLAYLIVLFGLIQNIEKRKLLYITNTGFIFYQIFVNLTTLEFILQFLNKYSTTALNIPVCIKQATIYTFLLFLICLFLKLIYNKQLIKLSFEKKYIFYSSLYALLILGLSLYISGTMKGI